MENYIIREAIIKDAYDIFKINRLLALNFCDLECVNYDFIIRQIDDNKYYVLEYENKVVAAISISIDKLFSTQHFIIDTLAVKEEYHKKGFGTLLVNYILENIWLNSDYNEIFLGTFKEYNTVEFYAKFGFEIQEIYNDIYNDNKQHKAYLLGMNREKYESKKYNGKLH